MIKSVDKQSGSIILVIMLVLIVAASFTLVSGLNASNRTFIRQQGTMNILQQAKAALIAYAVTYPERTGNPASAPGTLPCPDTNNNGQALANCSFAGGTTTGRLPWRTLNSSVLADQSGELLWYVVTDNYRTPLPLGMANSDTPGQLAVDGIGDIVAVIIAPGEPVTFPAQNRTVANLLDPVHYLEGENADGDVIFTQNSGGNDALIYITRQELMQAIEKRVLGDIKNILSSYRQDVGVYPWLAAFAPLSADHDAVVNMREGYIAYNDVNEVFPLNQFSVSWDMRSGGNGAPFAMTPTAMMPDWNSFPAITLDQATPFSVTGSPECMWTTREEFICNGRTTETSAISDGGSPWEKTGTSTRAYDFTINLPAGGTVTVPAATNTIRVRNNSVSAPFPVGTSVTIQITETATYDNSCHDITGNCNPIVPPETTTVTQSNTITTATDADIIVTNVTYDFGAGDEIPQWFVTNNWHKLALIAYSAGDIPDAVGPCSPGGVPPALPCLTIQGTVDPIDNKRAIVVMAGQELTGIGQDRTTTPDPDDYFENQNNLFNDDIFVQAQISPNFNDLARAIEP